VDDDITVTHLNMKTTMTESMTIMKASTMNMRVKTMASTTSSVLVPLVAAGGGKGGKGGEIDGWACTA